MDSLLPTLNGEEPVIFRARFANPDAPHHAAGPESLEVGLFEWDRIPWDRIAFPSVLWALNAWRDKASGALGAPAGNPADDRRGVHRLEPTSIG